MHNHQWIAEFPAAITVCDAAGIILEMNDLAAKGFEAQGGRRLVGRNLLDCHPEPSRSKLQELLVAPQRNVYIVEKDGLRKLVYQTPWHQNGRYAGLVEIDLEVPASIPHVTRGG